MEDSVGGANPYVQSWVQAMLGWFYPEWCQICRKEPASPKDGYVGESCRSGLHGVRLIEPPYCSRCGLPYPGEITGPFSCSNCAKMSLHFSWARAAVVATELVLEVIHHYKYNRELWFEPFLANLLVRAAVPTLDPEAWDQIVPVPLHPVRERERGFNQAVRLGRCLARATGLPLNVRALRRVEMTETQTLLTRQQRSANVRRAFGVWDIASLDGKRVVLVDDVLTTGATTSACAKALLSAGALDVCVWTVARGL